MFTVFRRKYAINKGNQQMGLRLLNLIFGESVIWQRVLKTWLDRKYKGDK